MTLRVSYSIIHTCPMETFTTQESKVYTTLVPAYGRDYKSKKALMDDWNAGKDFMICDMYNKYDGSYINKEQADAAGGTYNIRYKQRTQVAVVKTSK